MVIDSFANRHIGPDKQEVDLMLKTIGASSIEELVDQTVPSAIRLTEEMDISSAMTEYEYYNHIKELGSKNKLFKTYIGQGYYNTITPAVIQRNILENPGWYTAYTPYQSEIAQGRLEALINFQTMVSDLTGMEIANASLLDEATAAAEAMIMLFNICSRDPAKKSATRFFVSKECFAQTISVLKTRSEPLGIDLEIGDHQKAVLDDSIFGAIIQYPASDGAVNEYTSFVEKSHQNGVRVAVAADLLSLALLKPPGKWGADVVIGSTQRFGVPLGYGGPHAAYYATKEEYKRYVPGRIIGVSQDVHENLAYRMALQTREQHIRRDKATSNICTSQVLLAVMAGMYGVYHGAKGIRSIAEKIHYTAVLLATELEKLGLTQENEYYFDTLNIKLDTKMNIKDVEKNALDREINFRYIGGNSLTISVDETTSLSDLSEIVRVFTNEEVSGFNLPNETDKIPKSLKRKSGYLSHPVFNTHHSETEMMRYIKTLEKKDLSLNHSMIPLGSCTMKLNAAVELFPLSWPEFGGLHPYIPIDQAQGYGHVFTELKKMLCEITGFDGISLQPNSGAQGEYAGLLVIRSYHKSRGDDHRNVVLIPSSAHGTNPASAVMAAMKVVVIQCDKHGNISLDDLKEKAQQHSDNLSAFMVTYPSTHGVFEEDIIEINKIIHKHGGQVYMDGANMNAQIGLTNPGFIGADVCHLNLHKTFAIPHGGGGPGMGPIGVAKHLVPFLPSHTSIETGGEKGISSISQAPWGSSLILLISYGYIKMLGKTGLVSATKVAILNANYIKDRLAEHFPLLYKGITGRVAHELILDCREFKRIAQVEVEDIAKRLIDYGYHAPTVSFPVAGTLMIEPTESEPLLELDRFCEAMISIREEIAEIEDGIADANDNVLKNAPHSAALLTADEWHYSYPREKAAYPMNSVRAHKFWPPVSRVDNAYGDRNFVCSCPPIEDVEKQFKNTSLQD